MRHEAQGRLRRGWWIVGFIILVSMAAACGGDSTARDGTTDSPPAGAVTTTTFGASSSTTQSPEVATTLAGDGCAKPRAAPGEYEGLSVFGETEQPYWIVVPESYADNAPAPLYLHLASGGGDHTVFLEGWRPYLGGLDGLMAMVNTTTPFEALVPLIDHLGAEYCVDHRRVHVLGTSSSSMAADLLACEVSDRIASAVVALGNGALPIQCSPGRPVPVLSFTGDVDRRAVVTLVEKWADLNGCDPDPTVENLGSGVARKTYQNCVADVVYYDIEGMGHVWPVHETLGPPSQFVAEYAEVDYLEDALRFFADHPLP